MIKNRQKQRKADHMKTGNLEMAKGDSAGVLVYRKEENSPKTENGDAEELAKMGNAPRASTNGMGNDFGNTDATRWAKPPSFRSMGVSHAINIKYSKWAKLNRLRLCGEFDVYGSRRNSGAAKFLLSKRNRAESQKITRG